MSTPSSPKEWLILQCQACGSPMKVRAQAAAGALVACPVCRSPVAIPDETENRSPEFRARIPSIPERSAEDSPRLLVPDGYQPAPEFAPTPDTAASPGEFTVSAPVCDDSFLRNLKSTEEHPGGRHVKVKKRRRKVSESQRAELMDWNTYAASLPEAEVLSDPWLEPMPIPEEVIREKEREFVVSEHVEGDQTVRRVKRVRKRRIFTLAQLFFRRLSYGMRVFTVSMVSAIAIGGIWYGIKVFREWHQPRTLPEVVEEQRLPRIFLSRQDEEDAAKVVAAFLAARGIDEKLPHVRLPNRVRPMMAAWYQRNPDRPATIGEIRNRLKTRVGDSYFVIVELDVIEPDPVDPSAAKTTVKSFAVEEFEHNLVRSYRLDWETAVEWREMSVADFRLQQPRTPVPFRLKIRDCNYYNHSFSDERRWLATELYYPYPGGRNELMFYGYIDRRSKVWNDLSMFTEGNVNPAVIVNIRYPNDPVSRDQVIIDSVAHPSWFYTNDTPPPGFVSAGTPVSANGGNHGTAALPEKRDAAGP
jgi:hypothetical protein